MDQDEHFDHPDPGSHWCRRRRRTIALAQLTQGVQIVLRFNSSHSKLPRGGSRFARRAVESGSRCVADIMINYARSPRPELSRPSYSFPATVFELMLYR